MCQHNTVTRATRVHLTSLWCRRRSRVRAVIPLQAWPAALLVLLMMPLTGCQTLPLQAGQDFVAAANALAQAESDYFDEIQSASDASHLLTAGANYAAHNGTFASVAAGLSRKDDFSKAKALRMAVMTQLQNYAQQVAAITTEAGGTWVADDAKAVTSNVDTLLTDIAALNISQQQAGLIQTAVTDLAQAIINNMTADELQSLAKQARKPIADIAAFVAQDHAKIETDNFASGLGLDQTTSMMNMLHSIYEDKAVHSAERFAALIEWRDWKPALVTKGRDIDAALKKLEQANDAMASKQEVPAMVLVQQATELATQAVSVSTGH